MSDVRKHMSQQLWTITKTTSSTWIEAHKLEPDGKHDDHRNYSDDHEPDNKEGNPIKDSKLLKSHSVGNLILTLTMCWTTTM
jgi:hypothetical protein